MRTAGAAIAFILISTVAVAGPVAGAAAPVVPPARLTSEQPLPGYPNQGIARVRDGWILSSTNALSRVDEQFQEVAGTPTAVPPEWEARGYNHVGDIDVVGGVIYAPFEQPDNSLGEQAMARFDARTLAFLDATPVRQHHASFVTVDPKTMIAYSTDQFGDDRVVRYDVRKGWKRLKPLRMRRFVDRIQGADVANGALWLSTDDATNGLYRVDLESGRLTELGNAGHVDGEGEGIDATALPTGLLHMVTVDAALTPIWLGHLELPRVAGRSELRSNARLQDSRALDSAWPPVLIGGVLLVAGSAAGAVIVMLRRARAALRPERGRR